MDARCVETRLTEACIALGGICVEEAKRADSPDLKAALVWHAIGFLDAARTFLPPARRSMEAQTGEPHGRNRPLAEEGGR